MFIAQSFFVAVLITDLLRSVTLRLLKVFGIYILFHLCSDIDSHLINMNNSAYILIFITASFFDTSVIAIRCGVTINRGDGVEESFLDCNYPGQICHRFETRNVLLFGTGKRFLYTLPKLTLNDCNHKP